MMQAVKNTTVTIKKPTEPLPYEEIQRVITLYPNTEDYKNLTEREYLARRVALLEISGVIKNQHLSRACGWSPSQLYALYSPQATRNSVGRQPVASWEHAATLHWVTHGFIHAQYSRPDYWEWLKLVQHVQRTRKKASA